MDIKELQSGALPALFDAGITPLIHGHRGIGKSQAVRQYADDKNYKFLDFRLGQMSDAGDLIGLPDIQLNEKGERISSKFMMPDVFLKIIEYCAANPDSGAVIFFDELNRANKDLIQAIFQMVLDHRLGEIVFPSNVHFAAAQNPDTEEYTVQSFDDSAFADRFCHIRLEPSVRDWTNWAVKNELNTQLISFIEEDPSNLEPKMETIKLDFIKPSRRSIALVSTILNSAKKVKANRSVIEQLVVGMLGIETAGNFFTFCKNHNEHINGLDVLNDFSKVKHLVMKHSDKETNRSDILRNVCDQIKDEMGKFDKLKKTQEKNLVQFLTTIPKDLAKSFLLELLTVGSFISTSTDKDCGLMGNIENPSKTSKYAKRLIDYFGDFTSNIDNDTSNDVTEEK